MFCERVQYKPDSGLPPPASSVRSICLKAVTGYIEPSWKVKPNAPENTEPMKNQRIVGILGPNIVVKMKTATPVQPQTQFLIRSTLTSSASDRQINSQNAIEDPELIQITELKSNQSKPNQKMLPNGFVNLATFLPKTNREKMVYETVVNHRSPQLAQLIRKKSPLDVPEKKVSTQAKEGSGLMISDVYSLSNDKKT